MNPSINYSNNHTITINETNKAQKHADKIKKKFSDNFANALINISNMSYNPTIESINNNFESIISSKAVIQLKTVMTLCKENIFLLTDSLIEILSTSDISKKSLKKIENVSSKLFEKIYGILLILKKNIDEIAPDAHPQHIFMPTKNELNDLCELLKPFNQDINQNISSNHLGYALVSLKLKLKELQDVINENCHVKSNFMTPHIFMVKNRTNTSSFLSLCIIGFNLAGLYFNIQNQEINFTKTETNDSIDKLQGKIISFLGEFAEFFNHQKIYTGLGFVSSMAVASVLILNAWCSRHVSREEDYKEIRTGELNNIGFACSIIEETSKLMGELLFSNTIPLKKYSPNIFPCYSPRQRHRSNTNPE